jgi:hypothetical protein
MNKLIELLGEEKNIRVDKDTKTLRENYRVLIGIIEYRIYFWNKCCDLYIYDDWRAMFFKCDESGCNEKIYNRLIGEAKILELNNK